VTRDRKRSARATKACCMVSELLEEVGIDRERLRRLRRQALEGIILMCRWQLDRMEESREPEPRPPGRGRKITVE
jgi:hypothetical protein